MRLMGSRPGVGALLLCALVVAGCGESGEERARATAGSAVVQSAGGSFDQETRATLAEVGIRQVFQRAFEIDRQDGELTIDALDDASIVRGTQLHLVVGGRFRGGDARLQQQARELGEALRGRLHDESVAGSELLGVHLDIRIDDEEKATAEAYAGLVRGLRRGLDKRFVLSVALPLQGVIDEGPLQIAAREADSVVVRVFGQPPSEPDDPSWWEVEPAVERALALEDANVAVYHLLIHTMGRARSIDESGRPVGDDRILRDLPLESIMRSGSIRLEPIFSFEGFDRQVFDLLSAGAGMGLGAGRAARGTRIRVMRPTAYPIAELVAALDQQDLPGRLGEVYSRLPGGKENLSVTPEQLRWALERRSEEGGPKPPLAVEVVPTGGNQRPTSIVVRITNPGPLTTGAAVSGDDWVEIRLHRGRFGSVDPGDFLRPEFLIGEALDAGREPANARPIRNADVVRLHYPLIDPGWTIESGRIRLRPGASRFRIEVRARRLLPGGGVVETEPILLPPDGSG